MSRRTADQLQAHLIDNVPAEPLVKRCFQSHPIRPVKILERLMLQGIYSETARQWRDYPAFAAKDPLSNRHSDSESDEEGQDDDEPDPVQNVTIGEQIARVVNQVTDSVERYMCSTGRKAPATAEDPCPDYWCRVWGKISRERVIYNPNGPVEFFSTPPLNSRQKEEGQHRYTATSYGILSKGSVWANQDRITEQMVATAEWLMHVQPWRRYLTAVQFMENGFLKVYILDARGIIISTPFNIHEQPDLFVRLFVGLHFSFELADTGIDTSVVRSWLAGPHNYPSSTMKVGERAFDVDMPLMSEVVVGGSKTTYQKVSLSGAARPVPLLMRDSWVVNDEHDDEAYILREAKRLRIKGIPRLIAHETVKIHGESDSTADVRDFLEESLGYEAGADEAWEPLFHRRFVLRCDMRSLQAGGIGSAQHFLSVFRDGITANRDLTEKLGYLHRDINLRHIQGSGDLGLEGLPQGILINFGLARRLGFKERLRKGQKPVGTAAFLSPDLLIATQSDCVFERQVCHEVESWILSNIWSAIFDCEVFACQKCFLCRGRFKKTGLAKWIERPGDPRPDWSAIGRQKQKSLMNDREWKSLYLDCVRPELRKAKPCLDRLRNLWKEAVLSPAGKSTVLTYAAVLDIIKAELFAMLEGETDTEDEDDLIVGPKRKRKRVQEAKVGDEALLDDMAPSLHLEQLPVNSHKRGIKRNKTKKALNTRPSRKRAKRLGEKGTDNGYRSEEM